VLHHDVDYEGRPVFFAMCGRASVHDRLVSFLPSSNCMWQFASLQITNIINEMLLQTGVHMERLNT
jgi:hypothetical protein